MNSNNPFSIEYSQIVNKGEKISSAVYLMSGYIDESEPIRLLFKKSSASLLSELTSLKDISDWRLSVLFQAKKIVSLSHMAVICGIITDPTFNLLKNEINAFIITVSNFSGVFVDSKPVSIEGHFAQLESQFGKELFLKDNSKAGVAHLKSNILLSESSPVSKPSYLPSRSKNLSRINNVVKDKNNVNVDAGLLGDRKVLITDILQKTEKLTVKDFTAFIKDCSEKTIQRDLAALVAVGLVTRQGERRWAKYSLVKA